jgi:hypothetical protein
MNSMIAKASARILTALLALSAGTVHGEDLKKEYAATLLQMADALQRLQILTPADSSYGAITCPRCNVLHTRAAEALYPFAISYRITGDDRYLRSAIAAGNWLIRQQQPDGSWKETPEEWTGTSTDQLLMMLLSFDVLKSRLSPAEREAWLNSMRSEFASINYVATTSATLAEACTLFGVEQYRKKAMELARRTVSKMDDDGFLNGEGGRNHNNKSGVDLLYDMEMSLWGLGYYATLTGDSLVLRSVRHALDAHLYFVYPDGSLDGSWGTRSNKWTCFGGATSDGCQILFSLFAGDDPRCATASRRNLQFLRTCMKDGIVGYGPQSWEVFTTPPCIYPTFTKAKSLALAYHLGERSPRTPVKLPADRIGWMKLFRTIDVVEVRTENLMGTVTGYGYEDQAGRAGSKYMYRPTGGALSDLWVAGHGYLQASSVTVYSRPEPMSFPEAPGILSLTPRIEYEDSTGYFTNLFEFDSRLDLKQGGPPFRLTAQGELKDKNWLTGGVAYRIEYAFGDRQIRESITLTYHDAWPVVRIIEPVIRYEGMTFTRTDGGTVHITGHTREFDFRLIEGDATLVPGRNEGRYWSVYPALKAYPIELVIDPPREGFVRHVSFGFDITR